jgi:hypothetical protein
MGSARERHCLFRCGAFEAARIAARRSNVRKKSPPNIRSGNIEYANSFRRK